MSREKPAVRLYTTRSCPFCVMARRLLSLKGVVFQEIPVDGDPQRRRAMAEQTGRRTVPQIFIGERHIGGFEDMAELDRRGALDPMLDGEGAA